MRGLEGNDLLPPIRVSARLQLHTHSTCSSPCRAVAQNTRRERFSDGDKSCDEPIIPQVSGFCLCEGNVTAARWAGRWWHRRGRATAARDTAMRVQRGQRSQPNSSREHAHLLCCCCCATATAAAALLRAAAALLLVQDHVRPEKLHMPGALRCAGGAPSRRAGAANAHLLPLLRCSTL